MPFLLELHNLALISNVVKFNYNYDNFDSLYHEIICKMNYLEHE